MPPPWRRPRPCWRRSASSRNIRCRRQQVAAGDFDGAVERLKALGTRLLASGQPNLARVALTEATRIERTRAWSEDSKKQLKYGTRSLIAGASGTGRMP